MAEDIAPLPNHCAVSDCFDPAEKQSRLILEPMADTEPVTLGVLLCTEHRGLLRYGVVSCEVDA